MAKPPGKKVFERETGIREHQWSGVYWPRWGDAVVEAGLERNALQGRYDTADVLANVVQACRHFGRVPSMPEMRMYRITNPSFPSHGTIAGHFPTKADLISALASHADQNEDAKDIAAMLPFEAATIACKPVNDRADGYVYLLASGNHYKIGRSDDLERRMKEIRIALPEAVTLVHTIRTDDPAGIESYWHRRFAERRANGEWFKLSLNDLAAFKRRKYQ